MVQSCLLLRGDQENQSEGTSLPSGGGVINPVLALYVIIFIYIYIICLKYTNSFFPNEFCAYIYIYMYIMGCNKHILRAEKRPIS